MNNTFEYKNENIKEEMLESYEETNKKLEENIDEALRTRSLGMAGKFHEITNSESFGTLMTQLTISR